MSAGIDYGMGRANINTRTGIRYGVISSHAVADWVAGEAECTYAPCTGYCREHGEYGAADYCDGDKAPCPECGTESYVSSGDEPISRDYTPNDPEYQTGDCLGSDIIITLSPFFTFARFCSPCVPGAGDLDGPDPDGVKTYCLGHDFFEEGTAPYPVYSVATGEEVNPEVSNA